MKVISNSICHSAERQKASFPKESVENADLSKTRIEQNNDHTRIMRKTKFRSSFKSKISKVAQSGLSLLFDNINQLYQLKNLGVITQI